MNPRISELEHLARRAKDERQNVDRVQDIDDVARGIYLCAEILAVGFVVVVEFIEWGVLESQ